VVDGVTGLRIATIEHRAQRRWIRGRRTVLERVGEPQGRSVREVTGLGQVGAGERRTQIRLDLAATLGVQGDCRHPARTEQTWLTNGCPQEIVKLEAERIVLERGLVGRAEPSQ